MTKEMRIFQYMSIQKVPLLHRILQRALRQECIIVLDLEDSLSDIDTQKTKSIKKWGRSELTQFAHSYRDFFRNKKVGIRVNGLKSGEFERDLETVAEISQIWDLHCIVGPKIDSRENIQEYLSCLENKGVRYKTFIPIVETVKGINNLSSIVSYEGIADVTYGHFDYSLDSGHWPFFEQDEAEFWQISSHFIQKVEEVGVRYIHPPISYCSNEALFAQVWLRLQRLCHLSFGVMSLNSAQTALFNRLKAGSLEMEVSELRSTAYSLQDKIDKALYVKEIGSMKERNFGFNLKTGKFISPHEYMAALQFLEQFNG